MRPRCNVCGHDAFVDFNRRPNVRCPRCGSLERTRLLMLHLERFDLRPSMRVLHLAPEGGLANALSGRVGEYVPADFDVERYRHIPGVRPIDLTRPASYEAFGRFDLIIHLHVIEHIPYNYSALLLRLHRMLTPTGVHAFGFPIYGGFYTEHWGPLTGEEATARFGQFDHVRRLSAPDIDRSVGAIFDIREPDYEAAFGAEALRDANVPDAAWRGWTGHSIFWLGAEAALFR
jgi:phosphoglycolate phosphatase